MKIFELHATTGYTGLIISVRGIYIDNRGYSILSKKAVEIYNQKVKDDPRLAEHKLRLVIFERETDENGIFRLIRTIYRDYGFENGDVRNNIVLIEEQIFNK